MKLIEKVKRIGFKNIFLMNVGFLCCAISTVIFLNPTKMVSSGSTGLSIFLSNITGIHYYYFLYSINFVLIVIAFFTLGKKYTFKTIYGSLMLPTYGMLLTYLFQWINFDIYETIKEVDPIFIVLFASILMGVGIGMNMRLGGSTGGFDILESLGLKYFHIPYSVTIYALDAILVILGMWFIPEDCLFENFLAEGLAATTYIVLLGFVVDIITFGGYNKRAVFIRSEKHEQIHDAIINKLVRGMTYIDSEGGFSHEQTKMIVCICYNREYFILRDYVKEIDPNAFMFATRATEVRGLGFDFETPEHIAIRKQKKAKK